MLRGVAYSVSKSEFRGLLDEAIRKLGGEEKFVELMRRKKVGRANVELLFDMMRNGEVPLELFGAVLDFVEKAQGVEIRVQEMIKKTTELVRRMGVDLLKDQEISGRASGLVDGEGGGGSFEEELRRKGYAFLGQLIARYLKKEGLLDERVFELIMAFEQAVSAGVGGKKTVEDDVEQRLKEIWERLGMEPKFKLSRFIEEVYELLERSDLLIWLYNGRGGARGRRGKVASYIDVLEILREAYRKAGGGEKFFEWVRRRTGKPFYGYQVNEELARHRLDEEILRAALEYVYEMRGEIDERWRLIERNVEYILTRLMEETFFLAQLEQLLEPLAELNRRLGQLDQESMKEEYSAKEDENLEQASSLLDVAPLGVLDAESEVKSAETSSSNTVMGENTESAFSLVVKSLMKSLGLEERLWRIFSGEEKGGEPREGESLRFLKLIFGESNLRYVLELVSYGLTKGFKESEEEATVGEALEEIVEYTKVLLEEAGKTLLSEKVGRLSDDEISEIIEAAVEKHIFEITMVEAVIEKCNELVLEQVTKKQPSEKGTPSDERVEPLIEAVEAVKRSLGETSPPVFLQAGLDYKEKALTRLAEEIGTTVSRLRRYLDAPYNERESITRYDYYKVCDVLGIPPRDKQVCKVDSLRALLEAREKLDEELGAENVLDRSGLRRALIGELGFYEMLEEEALRIYHGDVDRFRLVKESPDYRRLLVETVENFFVSEEYPLNYLKILITREELLYALERWLDMHYDRFSDVANGNMDEALQLFGNLLRKAVKILLEQSPAPLNNDEKDEILEKAKNKGKELYVALTEAKSMMKMPETPRQKMKYLKDVVDQSDIKYTLEIFLTKLIPRRLISSGDEKEAERMRKAVQEAVKYYERCLEKTVDILLNERIEKLSDEEIKHIIFVTREMYPKEWGSKSPRGRRGEEGFELGTLEPLACELNMNMTKFRNYFVRKYKNRTRLTKYDYFRIFDALKLNSTISKFRIDRKAFLKALFKGEKRASLEEQETLLEEDKEQFFLLHWSQQPPGTHCIFFKEDRRMLRKVALKKCGDSMEELARILLDEMGVEYATPHILRAFTEKRAVDVELVLALIGFIIGLEPEEIVELIKGGGLAEKFKNSVLKQELLDEGNLEWLSNLPSDVVREVDPRSLKEEFEKLTESTSLEQDELYNEFFANLPRNELDKLKEAMNKSKKEEGSSKRLYAYVAEKLNKHLKEKVNERKIESILRGQNRVDFGLYLLMCRVFKVEPNYELHFRSTRSLTRYLRRRVTEIDFPTPAVFMHPSGETIVIEEGEGDFFVVSKGKRLSAEKWKTQYGGKWWGVTVIDYVTEEGVFGVVKEAGELWLPHERPWYTHSQDRMVIGFKTAQPIRNLIRTIQDKTGLSLNEISEITEIDESTIAGKLEGEMGREEKTITLGILLTLLGLKSTVAQTDLKSEIRQLEEEICSMGEIKIPEEQKQNILYINLRTPTGASLIGHLYGDGNLRRRGRNILFSYSNTEREYIEAVRKLLNFYGKLGNVQTRKGTEKYKEQYDVTAGGFLGYALWCAVPQAEGPKPVNNPKVPSWITDDRRLAIAFLQAIISDEAHIQPKTKQMSIGFAVDITEILKKKGLLYVIQNIVVERLRELEVKWDSLGLSKEELTDEQKSEERKARTVNIERVLKEEFGEETVNNAKELPPNILIGVKMMLQTLEINSAEEDLTRFYVSKTGAVTTYWEFEVYRTGTEKAYELNLFEGYKKQNYERNYKKMVRNFRLDNKLSRELLYEFGRIQGAIGMETAGVVPITKVKNHWDSKRFGDFMEFINKYVPEDIKKKEDELEEKGINEETHPEGVYFRKGKGAISIVWVLEWFE